MVFGGFKKQKTTGFFQKVRFSQGKLLKTIVKQSLSAVFFGKIEVFENPVVFFFLETLLPWGLVWGGVWGWGLGGVWGGGWVWV